MDRLLRQRLREARRSGRVVTSISSLPAELIGSVMEYACPYIIEPYTLCWWLQGFMRVACVNKSFLEGLKYVGSVELDLSNHNTVHNNYVEDTDFGHSIVPAYDIHVQRWCDIVRRRFRHVRSISDGGTRNLFSPRQTQMLVDCFASFPGLEDLRFYDADAVTVCVAFGANFRVGRFRNLKRLVLDSYLNNMLPRHYWGPPPQPKLSHVYARQQAKICFADLLSQLPPDRGMDLLLRGLYPSLLGTDDEWDLWATTFFDLISRGADVHSRDIICELASMHDFIHDVDCRTPARRRVYLDTIEKLLTVHGADPNACAATKAMWGWGRRPALWRIMDDLAGAKHSLEPDSDVNSGDMEHPDVMEDCIRFVMRVLDLHLQHGARCSAADP